MVVGAGVSDEIGVCRVCQEVVNCMMPIEWLSLVAKTRLRPSEYALELGLRCGVIGRQEQITNRRLGNPPRQSILSLLEFAINAIDTESPTRAA